MSYFLTLWLKKLAKFGSLMSPAKITSIHPRFLLKLISPKQFKAPSLRPRNKARQFAPGRAFSALAAGGVKGS